MRLMTRLTVVFSALAALALVPAQAEEGGAASPTSAVPAAQSSNAVPAVQSSNARPAMQTSHASAMMAGDAALADPVLVDAVSAMVGIFAHEFGHFMVGELNLPVTGPDEDVADEFAAMSFIDTIRPDPMHLTPMALAAARLWLYLAEDEEARHDPSPWYDEHSPDLRRFGLFVCDLYGAYPQSFAGVMEVGNIPPRRRERCVTDERHRHAAWAALLRPHRRRNADPDFPGDLPANTPGGRVSVEWRPAADPLAARLSAMLQRGGGFEAIAATISNLEVLPRDTKIIFRDCGVINAFYDTKDGSVTMCHELMGQIYKVFRRHAPAMVATVSARADDSGLDDPNKGGETLARFLRGFWRVQTAAGTMTAELAMDGSYRMTGGAGGTSSAVSGRWSAVPMGKGEVQLSLVPMQASGEGLAHGVAMMPQTAMLHVQDTDTMMSPLGMVSRMH